MKKSNIPVLIIGAGPTGLMAAAQLQRFGIDYRIIEKRKGTTPYSKALGVQARTLEIYEQMGIAQKAVLLGQEVKEVQIMAKGKAVQSMPLSKAGADQTQFPFMLILEQSKNEDLIYEKIAAQGGKVEFNTEMIDFDQQETHVNIKVKNKAGEEELITADWVIAADGGRSPIRHYLNIPFEGDTYKNIFYVVDTEVKWDNPKGNLYVNLAENNFTGFFPIRNEGTDRFRLVGLLPEEFQDTENITFDIIKKNIEEIQGFPIEFGETNWFSVYKVHHRCIGDFRNGRTFFAGDAAHVHSPAGGQGMNTGFQDAYNLAWKLALVIQKNAPLSLLDSYNTERLPVAQKLVNTTDKAFTNIVKKGALINFFRLNIMPFFVSKLMGINSLQHKAFKTVSQIGVRYKRSPISVQNVDGQKDSPKAGDRLPYIQVYDEASKQKETLSKLLGEKGFHAVIWLSNQDKIANTDAYTIKDYLHKNHPTTFDTHIFHDITENMAAYQKLDLKESTIYIVRPDNYIGYIGAVDDTNGLQEYLKKILL